jgi:carbamoyl-phosphate synthase small subunit
MPGGRGATGLLLLEDGSVWEGLALSPGTRFGEVVFNTSMAGYQEVLTDPSYCGQIVVMTYPHIGNYGVSAEDAESPRPWVEGFVVRQATSEPSSHRAEASLPEYLMRHRIPALEGIDTRGLVRRIRERGSMKGVLTTERSDVERLLVELRDFPSMEGWRLVDRVTRREVTHVSRASECKGTSATLAVYDFGIKQNIVRELSRRGLDLVLFPASTPAREILAGDFDGVVLSNGPGDPAPLVEVIENVRELLAADLPILGICLGHQLLGLALGARTYKLRFGHHGANHPVQHLVTGAVEITSQNHGFAVDAGSFPSGVRTTEINLNDRSVEAFSVDGKKLLSVQYHPEAAPGPHDAGDLFDRFLDLVKAHG